MEAEKLDALLLGNLDKVKDQLEAKLLLTGQPMHAKDLAVASGATLRDVVNALCDSSRFRRISRGVYKAVDRDSPSQPSSER